MTKLFFQPDGKKHGDFSLIEKDGKLYSIFIENDKGAGTVTSGLSHGNSFGLAVSDDGVTWKYLQKIKSPGPEGSWNDKSLWAMHVFEHEKEYLMIYSAISNLSDGELRHPTQQFGMARSVDLIHWEDFGANPVIANTDTSSYYYPNTMHRFCWRDANVYKVDGDYYAILAASDLSKPHEVSGCTGLLKTKDFLSWDALPPLFSPGRYREVETPHLYRIYGKWVLIFGENTDSMSMRFALSDSMFGSYAEPLLNVFTPAHCYAGMMIERSGQWHFYHWIMDRRKGKNERYMTPPKLVELKDDFLFLHKHPQLDGFFTQTAGADLVSEINGAAENRAVVRKNIYGELILEFRSKNEEYSRNVFITKTSHGVSVRDFTLDDRFNESCTVPLNKDGVLDIEMFFEGRFLEIYIAGYLVYSIVLEFEFSNIETIELKEK